MKVLIVDVTALGKYHRVLHIDRQIVDTSVVCVFVTHMRVPITFDPQHNAQYEALLIRVCCHVVDSCIYVCGVD